MTIKELRRNKLLQLVEKFGSQKELGESIKKNPSAFSQIISGKRGMGDTMARELEIKLDLPVGWFDHHENMQYKIEDGKQVSYCVLEDIEAFNNIDKTNKIKDKNKRTVTEIELQMATFYSMLTITQQKEVLARAVDLWNKNREVIESVSKSIKLD